MVNKDVEYDLRKILKELKWIPLPLVAKHDGENLKFGDQDLIPKYCAKEFLLMIDLLFYGYLYTAILSWFGNIQPWLNFQWYFLMVVVFFTFAVIGLMLKHWLMFGSYFPEDRKI